MLLGTGLIVGSALAAETPQELFQKALVKERSEGKLREEIPLLRKGRAKCRQGSRVGWQGARAGG